MADDHPIEEWRIVEDWPAYEVSNLGRVRRGNRVLKSQIDSQTGYPRLELCMPEGRRRFAIHTLVCVAFHGPKPSDKHEVAHWDGIKTNVVAGNLRWATREENNLDKFRHGTTGKGLPKPTRGERHPQAKLTQRDVDLIRASSVPTTQLLKIYAVDRSTINAIRSWRSWLPPGPPSF